MTKLENSINDLIEFFIEVYGVSKSDALKLIVISLTSLDVRDAMTDYIDSLVTNDGWKKILHSNTTTRRGER